MTIAHSEWKDMMKDFLDGVERELRPSASMKTKVALNVFRSRLNQEHTPRRRKHFEQELEAFFQSGPFLRAAAKRYLRKRIIPAIETAVALVKRAQPFLTKDRTKRRV
jgi:hypothetical protein